MPSGDLSAIRVGDSAPAGSPTRATVQDAAFQAAGALVPRPMGRGEGVTSGSEVVVRSGLPFRNLGIPETFSARAARRALGTVTVKLAGEPDGTSMGRVQGGARTSGGRMPLIGGRRFLGGSHPCFHGISSGRTTAFLLARELGGVALTPGGTRRTGGSIGAV